jgi:hypothetical protein
VKLIKLAVIVTAVLAVAGHYWTELRRLKRIHQLPGIQARDYYETTRISNERMMAVLTALFVAGAVTASLYLFGAIGTPVPKGLP